LSCGYFVPLRFRVNRFTSTQCPSLPVFIDQRTSPDRPDWSGLCQKQKPQVLFDHLIRAGENSL
jgi:hypothetical protein